MSLEKKNKEIVEQKQEENIKSSFLDRMSYEGGTYTPPNGKPTMTRAEALKELGFEPDSED